MSEKPPVERNETDHEDIARRFTDHVTRHAVEPDTDLEGHPTLFTMLPIETPGPIPCDTVFFHVNRYYPDSDSDDYELIHSMTFMIRDATIHEVTYDGDQWFARIGNAEDVYDQAAAFEYAERIVTWADDYLTDDTSHA